MPPAKVISTGPLEISRSKFRVWECAERKVVEGFTGKDAVAVVAILKSKTNAFPLSTVVIEQYRPPIDKLIIGTSDPEEEAEATALRELEEETGYRATLEDVIECSPTVVCDPGMTTAKMKLVMEYPVPHPDPGEHIVVKVVELAKLKQGFMVDARLSHFATGYDMAERVRNGLFS
ncbi:hypothetical protein BU15DRAFT_87935 [Melanogaster broomeanus]|nr:hypothetical protein BU15DRAFT_87935 [Melanogaster broomeanus]